MVLAPPNPAFGTVVTVGAIIAFTSLCKDELATPKAKSEGMGALTRRFKCLRQRTRLRWGRLFIAIIISLNKCVGPRLRPKATPQRFLLGSTLLIKREAPTLILHWPVSCPRYFVIIVVLRVRGNI